MTAQTQEMTQTPLELKGDELLVVENLKKYFPITRGIISTKRDWNSIRRRLGSRGWRRRLV